MKASGTSFRVSAILASTLLIGTLSFAQESKPAAAARETKDAAKKTGNVIKDSWITMKVHSQFIPEDTLEGSDINVDTNKGVVTLKGTVASEAGRDRAIAIAKATDGVKNVTNQLRIGATTGAMADARAMGDKVGAKAKETAGTTGRAVTDGWIRSKVYAQFITEDALEDSDINVDVSRGTVVLNGVVRSEAGQARAEAIAKSTDGVKTVKNNLKVSPKVK
jgi:hyperosmotically inducible periplasmic protein